MSMPGGLGEVLEADDNVEDLVEECREEVERKSGRKFAKFSPVTYKSQVVAGTNFFVKVDVSKGEFVHLRIFCPLPNQGIPELQGYQLNKTKEDPIEYFE